MAMKPPTTNACITDTYLARTIISSSRFSLARTNNNKPRINTENTVRGMSGFMANTTEAIAATAAIINPTALKQLGKMNR